MNNYILVDGNPVVEPDLIKWAKSFGETSRTVNWTLFVPGVYISTVFLGLDHQFGQGPPLLYESMVFGGVLDGECERYSTREEALAGHEAMWQRVRIAEEIGAQTEPTE